MKHISEGIGPEDGTLRLLGVWDSLLMKGQGFRPHAHDSLEEAYYILEGEGEMFLEGESREVGPGSIIYIPPRSVHFVRATGDKPLRVITVSIDVGEALYPLREVGISDN